MKALKSQLAKDVLADTQASGQLRAYLAMKSSSKLSASGASVGAGEPSAAYRPVIELQSASGQKRLRPTTVPKAA